MRAFILLTLILAACTPASDATIGFIGPLTGDASQWGIPPSEGAALAAREHGVHIVYEDSKCDPKLGVAAAQKLITQDKVTAIVGAICSSVTLAITPIAEAHNVVLISPASTNPKITDTAAFRVVPSDAHRGEVFAHYLYDKNVRTVGIIHINNDGGLGNRESFTTTFVALGGTVAIVETYDQEATDMRTQLLKLNDVSPEAIVAVSHPADSILLLQQARELGITIPFYFQTEAPDDPSVLTAVGDAADIEYILAAPATGATVDRFVRVFEEYYEKEPALYAAEGYDAVTLLAASIASCGDAHSCIKEYIHGVREHKGASGTITIDENGDVQKPMAIKRITDGEKKIIKII
ncbi:MAG: ABC transporter substrate-binding protein [Candidatus Woesearchaeota archaeon]|nr:ABC transporter substrate-binding protein [Candidatus Woesearchaeota archaeon]